jgi:glycosyltransferase involved in cell wall biosynthesis
MRRAAERGHEVRFVESGSFLLRDVRSIIRHPRKELRRRVRGEVVGDRVHTRSALTIVPWGKKYPVASTVNFGLTAPLLRRVAKKLPQPVVLWMYDPCAVSLIGSLGEAFAVYDCVDDYPEQYGPDRRRIALVATADRAAARLSRLVFTTTDDLAQRHRQANPRTYLVPNAADFPHFARAADPELAPQELRDLSRPVIGFAGNLTSAKVDFSLLRAMAAERPDWTLLLVGPARADAEGALASLTSLPNVRWLGWKPYEDLPRYVAAFDVGLCPYQANAYTRNVFPLKVYEYLAAGKPVIAAGTPTLAGLAPDVVLADGPESFVASVEAALRRSGAERKQRMALAARNTWDARTERLLGLITAELEASRQEYKATSAQGTW